MHLAATPLEIGEIGGVNLFLYNLAVKRECDSDKQY